MSMTDVELSPDAVARRRAGRAVRDLGHVLVGHGVDRELLDEVAGTLTSLTERLSTGTVRSRATVEFRDHTTGSSGSTTQLESYDDRPFSGLASPWGLDIEVHQHGEEVEAAVTLREAHEGAPGRSHGGIVAALFDDVFGFILGVIKQPAFTGELSIRYEAGTPLHRPLVCRGRLAERSGRKLWIEGELVDITTPGEPVVARAKGLFITVDPERFKQTTQLPAPPPDD
jgi:acyl-coenzyme A thioesterase PaaI-like protein